MIPAPATQDRYLWVGSRDSGLHRSVRPITLQLLQRLTSPEQGAPRDPRVHTKDVKITKDVSSCTQQQRFHNHSSAQDQR